MATDSGPRVNSAGLAYAGSQRQIQLYVNRRCEELSRAAVKSLGLAPETAALLQWVSPVEREQYKELRDVHFLRALGLDRHAPALKRFWPGRGPSWDALATLDGARGCILLEAKSHVSEIYGDGCRAAGKSRKTICDAIEATKKWLGVPHEADWLGKLYQSANRYAHLYFLREECGVGAHLLNVYFIDDRTIREPASQSDWDTAIGSVKAELGLARSAPHCGSAFLKAITE